MRAIAGGSQSTAEAGGLQGIRKGRAHGSIWRPSLIAKIANIAKIGKKFGLLAAPTFEPATYF
jgi:hypothetical protein